MGISMSARWIKRGRRGARGGCLEVLSRDQIQAIHYATLEVLWETGINVKAPEGLNLLHEGGADTDQTKQTAKINNGQRLSLALKLPDEKAFMALKAQVVHRDDKGFGCRLLSQGPKEVQALKKCFDVFSGMLPID